MKRILEKYIDNLNGKQENCAAGIVGFESPHIPGKKFIYKKKDLSVNEGTWAIPNTIEKAEELKKLFDNPIPLGKCEKMLWNKIGDDSFYDEILKLKDSKDKDFDVRPIASKYISKWIKEKIDLDKKAIEILKDIVRKF